MIKKLSFLFWFAFASFTFPPASAMTVSSISKITTNPEHVLYGHEDSFALSGQKVVWLDYRDPQGVPQVFAAYLNDPNFTEFLIDPDAAGAYTVAFADPFAAYTYTENYASPTLLKVANIQNLNEPILTVLTPLFPDIYGIDISDHLVVYYGPDAQNEYLYTVLAADFSDPSNPLHFLIDIAAPDVAISSLALDGSFAVWNEIPSDGPARVKIADLSNPAQPQIVTITLPESVSFDRIAVSDNNLVARGYRNWQMYLYAVKNYRQTDSWVVQTLWAETGSNEFWTSGPKIDGSIAIWGTTTQMPAAAGGAPLQWESLYRLKAAYLLDRGASISTLLTFSEPNQIFAGDIDDLQLVWAMHTQAADDLFKGSLVLECGDWGYKPGDINKDCIVNLEDLSCLAQNWLTCTTPEQEGCEYGS